MSELPAHYLWWILALLLIASEVLLPGYFLLWIGIAELAKESLGQQQKSVAMQPPPR